MEKSKVTKEELSSLRQAFALYDTNKKGAIHLDQFASILKSLNIETDDKKIKIIVNRLDNNQDGHIDFDEFVIAMNKLLEEPDKKHYSRSMSRHEPDELQLCFAKFDKNGDGQISVDELKEVMHGLGEKLTLQELKDMMKDADTNKDGSIDFQEFKALMPTQ